MQKSKFFRLFLTLDGKELSDFSKYIKRRHGTTGVIPYVFKYIKPLQSDFMNEKKFELDYAYRKIFKKPMGADRMKLLNALSDLHLLLKEFLMLEKVKTKSFENLALWTLILKERGLGTEFSNTATRLQTKVNNMPRAGIEDYIKGMITNYFFYYHLTQNKLSEDIGALQNCGDDLDLFYAISRLKIACEMANRKNLMSLEYDLKALPAIIELSNSKTLSKFPLLQLYQNVYELIAYGKDHVYTDIEKLLENDLQKIDPGEIHTVLGYLHNYAAAQIRRGNKDYWAMTHKLNKFGVKHKVFSQSGEMSSSQFCNIIRVACRANDFDWGDSFRMTHLQYLPENMRGSSFILGEAIILFEQKKYRQTLKCLSEFEASDLYQEIRYRSLILISNYELPDSETDIVESSFAFQSYLNRKRKPRREAVEAILRFLRIVRALARKKTSKEKILREINAGSPIYFKEWLLEKIAAY